jgi:RimJ/RimL family protein N-acetyltransferase
VQRDGVGTAALATTPRLRVRAWRADDAPSLAALGSDVEVVRYLGGVPWSVDDATRLISSWEEIDQSLGVTTWACEDRASGVLVGYCGFARTNAAWLRSDIVEIGWLVARDRWGEGLATEAAEAVLPLGLARFPPSRIVSKCDVRNAASERVMRKLGLRRAGVVRRPQDLTVVYRVPPGTGTTG